MTNFSPFFPDSKGLVTTVGVAPFFSGAGVDAHNIPEPKKSEAEMTRPRKVDFLKFDSIIPPKFKKDSTLLKRGLFRQNVKNIQIFGILSAGKM